MMPAPTDIPGLLVDDATPAGGSVLIKMNHDWTCVGSKLIGIVLTMNEQWASKETALGLLRMWRDTVDKRDDLVWNAARAVPPAKLTEIVQASGLAKNTVKAILEKFADQEDAMPDLAMQTPVSAHVDPWRHLRPPGYVHIDPAKHGHSQPWSIRPFTQTAGAAPRMPSFVEAARSEMSPREWLELTLQWRSAESAWWLAHFQTEARTLLMKLVEAWAAYTRARQAMVATFDEFANLGEDQWRAQAFRLATAHQVALAAAQAFDATAADLEAVQREYHGRAEASTGLLTVRDVATELGIDTTAWAGGFDVDDYETPEWGDRPTPLVDTTGSLVHEQRQRLQAVAAMVGDQDAGNSGDRR